MEKGDFGAARKYLADTLSFQGPIETFTGPEPYLESLKKLDHIIERADVKKMFVDGDDVCLLRVREHRPTGTINRCPDVCGRGVGSRFDPILRRDSADGVDG